MEEAASAGSLLETGAAAVLFAAVFLAGGRVHPLRPLVADRRSAISFAAGMSAAYVFVHVLPELHVVRETLVGAVSAELPYEGAVIYFVALVGFLTFYGLEHLVSRFRETAHEEGAAIEGEAGPAFRIHVGGFAAYVWLVAYLLVHGLEESTGSIALFAVALAVHFLTVDHSLREEYGAAYDRAGRFVLAGMAILGWAVGQVLPLPLAVVALLVAFISGAVIMNSAIMELPSERDGRFMPFLIGGLTYGAILLGLG